MKFLAALLLIPTIITIPVTRAIMQAPELFARSPAQIIIYNDHMMGLIYAPHETFLIYGAFSDCTIIQLTGPRILGEVIDGVYGAGTEKPIPCSIGKNGRGWIDFRGHHRPLKMRLYNGR